MNRRKMKMLSVVSLSAAIMVSVATTAQAETQTQVPPAHTTAPSSEQIADSMASDMAKKLDLSPAVEQKVASLFKVDGKAIRTLQMKLSEKRFQLNALSPKDKNYMKDVNTLADSSGELTKQLTIQYAKSRAELYELLTPQQIKKLENYGKHGAKPPKES